MRLPLLISLLFLVGCDPTIITKYKYIEVTKPTKPAALSLHVPHFYVVSDANQEEFKALIKKEANGVYFAITPKGYELLAENTQEFRRYIKQSKAIITYYESLLSADQSRTEE